AIAALAQQLADAGSTDTLDHRRAQAVGMLARGELALDVVSTGSTTGVGTGDDEPERTETGRVTRRKHRRDVVLYVHLSEDALRSHDPDAVVQVENAGGQLLTAGQVAEWCGRPDTDRIIVKPVINLNEHRHTDAYQVPDAVAEQVDLRDRECVFPWCHRPARRCDKDHTVPHDRGGPTCACNLAPLCRLHHRMKTHGGWTYTTLEPGTYLWRSPHGYTWLRDHTGTTDLTPPPVDPP
ncbi:MAG: HNH endonuclease, partial [Propionibacteriales bacterium]|nr:HNH endonuclease [Propionibacteriales bacterium]